MLRADFFESFAAESAFVGFGVFVLLEVKEFVIVGPYYELVAQGLGAGFFALYAEAYQSFPGGFCKEAVRGVFVGKFYSAELRFEAVASRDGGAQILAGDVDVAAFVSAKIAVVFFQTLVIEVFGEQAALHIGLYDAYYCGQEVELTACAHIGGAERYAQHLELVVHAGEAFLSAAFFQMHIGQAAFVGADVQHIVPGAGKQGRQLVGTAEFEGGNPPAALDFVLEGHIQNVEAAENHFGGLGGEIGEPGFSGVHPYLGFTFQSGAQQKQTEYIF